ncbi:hypothetical protein CONPUDRAFT_154931 [Coniophora puteana RWD-64-598 SS2]|uniref:Uncharacterized protein n=1 Tax=Coniophora puteana (strain RWD-64-598) TaxID=741705 RepID=A0A5M3ML42_CONPW|nr:uncharacterized protein CONPUDRAFT_154931 [Coniophora puteana RWD-64-598 SS2]EIW79534.1 hypothetical protein CONPUDRAFT_154931 [Coniophora puteana RWD-64-598 SS2]
MNSTDSLPSLLPALPQINLTPTLGLAFVGVVLASILYGFTALQTVFYYRTYPNDRLSLKFLVGVLWSLNTTSLAFKASGLYTWLVLDYAQLLLLADVPWGIYNEPAIVAVIALAISGISYLDIEKDLVALGDTARKWDYILESATVHSSKVVWELAPFAISMYTVWRMNKEKSTLNFGGNLGWTMIVALSLESSFNLVVAAALCYLLRQGATGFKSLNARQSIREPSSELIYELTAPSNGRSSSRIVGVSSIQGQTDYGLRSQKSTVAQRASDDMGGYPTAV